MTKPNKTFSPNNCCLQCSQKLVKKQKAYCSRICQRAYQYDLYIKKWQLGELSGNDNNGDLTQFVRSYIRKRYPKCTKCGWSQRHPITGKIPLTINHIDGNSENSKEENLEVICPNCHSLTPNYGILNKGNGRKIRREKRKQGLYL